MRSRSSGLIKSGRSGPSTIFSRASRKSFWRTSSCSRRAAKSAASFTRLARSAPESPGVEAASSPRSTLRASGTLLVWTLRIASRPTLSGRFTTTRRSKRPGLRSALSSTSGWLVAASTITPSLLEKPSISVRIWFRVCSCSLDPPDRRLTACAAYGVELVDEDDRRGVLARLLEEIPDAAGAHSHEQLHELGGAQGKERNPRLARHSPRQQRLARARGSHQQHALRGRPAQASVLVGVLEEVHDLDQLVFGLVYASYVVEGDPRLALLVVAPGAAPAEAREGAAHAAALPRCAPIEPDVAPDQEQRRSEGEEERRPPAAAFLYRLGADL